MRRPAPVGAFALAYVLAAVVGAFTQGNLEFVFCIAVMFVLIGVVWAVDRRVHLSLGALWGLSLWGLAHMIRGRVPWCRAAQPAPVSRGERRPTTLK